MINASSDTLTLIDIIYFGDWSLGYEQTVAWFRKAADQGNYQAQFKLGLFYEKGIGVELGYLQAIPD